MTTRDQVMARAVDLCRERALSVYGLTNLPAHARAVVAVCEPGCGVLAALDVITGAYTLRLDQTDPLTLTPWPVLGKDYDEWLPPAVVEVIKHASLVVVDGWCEAVEEARAQVPWLWRRYEIETPLVIVCTINRELE